MSTSHRVDRHDRVTLFFPCAMRRELERIPSELSDGLATAVLPQSFATAKGPRERREVDLEDGVGGTTPCWPR